MAEKSKGQGEKPWIPPNLAAVLHGQAPKSQLAPIDKISNKQLQPRNVMNSRSEEKMQPQPKRSWSSFGLGNVMEPRSIQEVQTQSEHSMSSLRLRNVLEPRSIDKVRPKPRSTEDTQPRPRSSNSPSSFRTLKDISTTSTDKGGSTKRKHRRQTFHKFSALPLELQTMIWQWYGRVHANSTPNIIKISHLKKKYRWMGPGRFERDPTLIVRYKLPPIFYVSKFTLKIAKELYEKEFQMIPMTQSDQKLTYFNEDKDIIVLEDSDVLMDWRYNRQTEAESTRRTFISPIPPAAERITRINMKHLVIGGTDRSLYESRLLARFYDCESIMLGVPYLIRSRFFSTEKRNEPDREAISYLRHRICFYWKEERQGPFVREDYRGKPTRPAVAEPSWDPTNRTISNPMFFICTNDEILSQVHRLHPAITNFLTPLPEAKSSINFMSDLKFSHNHATLFEHPWECVPKN